MSVIEEAKHYLNEPSGDIESDYCEGIDLVEKLIEESEQHKAITEAAKFLLEVKRHKDTQPAQYQAFMPTAWRKLEEAVGENNE